MATPLVRTPTFFTCEQDHGLTPVLADPDRSNPTRSRWERPLDTIRAFEAAIDGNYARKSGNRPDTDSRRTSYAGMFRNFPEVPASRISTAPLFKPRRRALPNVGMG